MKLIEQSWEWVDKPVDVLKRIEIIGRTCYKSEDKITEDSAEKFIKMIIGRKHESVLEHINASVRFITMRSVTHELVRHRLCAYSQESTRYISSVNTDIYNIENEIDVLEAYEYGFSMNKIANLSNTKYTEWEIYKILDKEDVKKRPLGNTGPVNHTFFDIIDTPEKAYLLGIILADGNIHKKIKNNSESYCLTLTQHKNISWYLLRMVQDLIRPSAKLNNDRNCNSIIVTSEHLCKSLINKGIIPNKSHLFGEKEANLLWESLPKNLIPDFLRGFLDGDGWLRFFNQKNKGETFSCNIGWCGSVYILAKISNWLKETFDYSCSVNLVKGVKNFGRCCITNPKIGIEFCDLIYKNFKLPYGNPIKTSRAFEQLTNKNVDILSWRDSKFQIILPEWIIKDKVKPATWEFLKTMDLNEITYRKLREFGLKPEEAREVLPNCLKTEIVVTTNLREWRHIFKMRTSKEAHPQIRALMTSCLEGFKREIPVIFDDIGD